MGWDPSHDHMRLKVKCDTADIPTCVVRPHAPSTHFDFLFMPWFSSLFTCKDIN